MFQVEKEFTFEAAHKLPNHNGKCARLHGHSWHCIIACIGTLQKDGSSIGMVIDYADIAQAMQPLLDNYLDHHYLNETLKMEHTTTENVARWIYDQLFDKLPFLYSVTIQETCTTKSIYKP